MSTFQSLVESGQRNGGPQEKRPLAENENLAIRSNQEHNMDKFIKRQKGVEIQPIAVGVDSGVDLCGQPSHKKQLY